MNGRKLSGNNGNFPEVLVIFQAFLSGKFPETFKKYFVLAALYREK